MDTTSFQSSLRQVPSRLQVLYRSLSPERVILFWVLTIISGILLFSALIAFNARFLITVPTYGGNLTEGIIGTPRFINPVLASTEQDKDLTALVYAGLTKKNDLGEPMLDMAESIIESEDRLRYTVRIKEDARFHDGSPVTADDIIYTVNLIQNPNIKSPRRIEWEGVTMEKISNAELVFSLKQPYPLFMNTLTVGILPKNLWKNLTDEQFSLSDYNRRALGSGPYAIKDIKSTSGIPHTFVLRAHKHYTLGRPYIDTITVVTYQNEKYALQAFAGGDISRIHDLSPQSVASMKLPASQVHDSLLPRIFTVFFNPNKATALSDKKVRQALQGAINKEAIVQSVLHDYGKVINAPFPFDDATSTPTYDPDRSRKLLSESRALKSSKLSITLATANTEEMRKIAEMIQSDWQAVGVEVTLAIYEIADLNQSVIKERDFQVLLFGSIVETPADLYAFWHSSQRTYPGLNISNYVSNKLDRNLEILRTESDQLERIAAYDEVKREFAEEVPGIFLSAPSLIYLTTDKATTILPKVSFDSSSRFTLVTSWHRYNERIWPKTQWKTFAQALVNIIH